MEFFNSGFFWFVEGVIFCLAVLGFKIWMEDRGVPMPFWKWILLGIWVFILGFSIAFVGTSLGEKEPNAALLGGIVFGLITIISGVGFWRILQVGKRPKEQSSGPK